MKKEKKELSFVCPHCKKKQTSFCEKQTGIETYEYDFESQTWETRSEFSDNEAQHEAFFCPNCEKDLDIEVLSKGRFYILKLLTEL